jgi:hypothetical protein
VKFEAEGDIISATSCNCSICQRKGSLLWFVPRGALRLLTPEEDTSAYLFHRRRITHRFCPVCGVQPYSDATAPSGEAMAAINIRCIEGIDLQAIPVTHFDGLSVP